MGISGDETVLTEIRNGYRILTLHRPDRLNAFTTEMHGALRQAIAAADADVSCRALILTGAGRGFCAGQDLSDRAVSDNGSRADLKSTLETLYNPLVRQIRALRMPVIAAVNGIAAGAGANVALNCDIVLAGRSAGFLQAFAKIGLVPDSGGTWLLPRLVGSARARALCMLAEPISAETAESWGMIWKAVDDDALLNEACTMAAHLATQPTYALSLIKQALDAAEINDMDAQLSLEAELQSRAGRSDDNAEGVAAFLEKRKPVFTGKPVQD